MQISFWHVALWLPSINSYVIWVVLSYLQVQVSFKFYIFPIRFFNFREEEHLEWWLLFLIQCILFDLFHYFTWWGFICIIFILCIDFSLLLSLSSFFPKSFCLSVYKWVCLWSVIGVNEIPIIVKHSICSSNSQSVLHAV